MNVITGYIIGALTGVIISIGVFYHININSRIRDLEIVVSDFPTPEEFAKKIMTMKMPISELPKDVVEAMREEALKTPQKTQNVDTSYLG